MKRLKCSYVGTDFYFDSQGAMQKFARSESRVSRETWEKAMADSPNGELTWEIIEAVLKGAKKPDTRLDVTQDGDHSCSLFFLEHSRKMTGANPNFTAEGFTVVDRDSKEPLTNRKDGTPLRAGHFSAVSRAKMKVVFGKGKFFEEFISRLEETTRKITGEDDVEDSKVLVAALCSFHRRDRDIRQLFGGTTDRTSVLARLAKYEESLEDRDSKFQGMSMIRSANTTKYESSRGRRNDEHQFGSAKIYGEAGRRVVETFPSEEGGVEKVAAMTPDELVKQAKISEDAAISIIRIVQQALSRSRKHQSMSTPLGEAISPETKEELEGLAKNRVEPTVVESKPRRKLARTKKKVATKSKKSKPTKPQPSTRRGREGTSSSELVAQHRNGELD